MKCMYCRSNKGHLCYVLEYVLAFSYFCLKQLQKKVVNKVNKYVNKNTAEVLCSRHYPARPPDGVVSQNFTQNFARLQ